MSDSAEKPPVLIGLDRYVLRVVNLPAAVRYYRDVLGLEVLREATGFATLRLADGREILLHNDDDLPGEGVFLLVENVQDLYERRAELRLTFVARPSRVARGFKATCRDPFGTPLLLIDRSLASDQNAAEPESAAAPGALFPGVAEPLSPKRDVLVRLYEKAGRTADDLPYTPQFESIRTAYAAEFTGPQPDHRETWRHLLSLRKRGVLPRLGAARESAPVDEKAIALIKELVISEFDGRLGRRDRLPYSEDFERLRDAFNARRVQRREQPMSPHALWRLVASVAK